MRAQIDNRLVLPVVALILRGVAVYVGYFLRARAPQLRRDARHDFDTVRTTTMTLVALACIHKTS